MLRNVFLIALFGVCYGSIFEQSLKFSSLRKGIHRFAMDLPKTTKEAESAIDRLQGKPKLFAKLEELRNALLLRGQPLGSFNPDAVQPFSPIYQTKNEASSATLVKDFSIKSCSRKPDEDRFVVNNLLLKPDPVNLPGPLTFIFNISVTQDLNDVQVALDLRKKIGETYIKIPCFGQYGSCTYDVCQLLSTVETCPPELVQTGFKCRCPFQKGSYVTQGISTTIEAAVFPTGDYMVIANMTAVPSLIGSDGVQVGCYNITLTIGDGN